MYILDSSVWVALFLDFDASHAKARQIWEELEGEIYLPASVLIEVSTVLTYKHSKAQADQFLEFVLKHQRVILMETDIHEAIRFFKLRTVKLSFTDWIVINLTQKLQGVLVTFDAEMIREFKKLQV
jgi:predicted nucleic acid-binding protein